MWRFTLRILHGWICRADDWCFAQERKMQDLGTNHESRITNHEFDREASRIRERAHRRAQKPQRLKYAGGQFVREAG